MKRNKILLVIMIVIMCLLSFTFISCDKKNEGPKKFGTKEDLMTVSAISVGNMMGTFVSTANCSMQLEEQDPRIAKVEGYLTTVNGILGKQAETELIENPKDYPDYSKKYIITANTRDKYVLVYNETLKESKQEEDETEEEFTIEGLLVINDKKYSIEGGRETEVEDGETETEFFFKALIDKDNYILFKQEIEQEGEEVEQEFKYSIYKNGELDNEFALEIEKDPVDNELEVKLLQQDLILVFESEIKSEEEYIYIAAKEGKETFKIKIKIDKDGNYIYYED